MNLRSWTAGQVPWDHVAVTHWDIRTPGNPCSVLERLVQDSQAVGILEFHRSKKAWWFGGLFCILKKEKNNNNLGSIWTIQLSHTLGADRLITLFFFPLSYSPARPNLQTFYQEAPKGYAKASPPDQRTQVHGHIPEAAHLLLSLQGVYLVRGSLTSLLPWAESSSGCMWFQQKTDY